MKPSVFRLKVIFIIVPKLNVCHVYMPDDTFCDVYA
jgi:hypothetical protein